MFAIFVSAAGPPVRARADLPADAAVPDPGDPGRGRHVRVRGGAQGGLLMPAGWGWQGGHRGGGYSQLMSGHKIISNDMFRCGCPGPAGSLQSWCG